MSVSYILKSGTLAACMACLLAPAVQGQQQELRRNQLGQSPTERQTQGQFDRQAGQSNQGNQEVDNFLAQCLLAKNKAEIELSEIATQEASDPQVKQFAQKMVQEHRNIVQKLEQIANGQMTSQSGQSRLGTEQARQPGQQQTRQPGEQQARQPGQQNGATQPGQQSSDRAGVLARSGQGQSGSQNQALQQIVRIEQQIAQKATDAMTEKLREKSGAEFDQAYLGCQVGSHMHMKSALEVISQQTSGQLAQLAEQTQQSVEQHLQEAERLMKQTEDGARQAQRQRPAQRE